MKICRAASSHAPNDRLCLCVKYFVAVSVTVFSLRSWSADEASPFVAAIPVYVHFDMRSLAVFRTPVRIQEVVILLVLEQDFPPFAAMEFSSNCPAVRYHFGHGKTLWDLIIIWNPDCFITPSTCPFRTEQ